LSLVFSSSGIASAETREAIADRYYNTFSHTNALFLRINPGDIVVTKTLNSGGIDDHDQMRAMGGNPLTGPFYITGAEPADAIVMHLRKVRLSRNWGIKAYRLGAFSFARVCREPVSESL
jgi:amidase